MVRATMMSRTATGSRSRVRSWIAWLIISQILPLLLQNLTLPRAGKMLLLLLLLLWMMVLLLLSGAVMAVLMTVAEAFTSRELILSSGTCVVIGSSVVVTMLFSSSSSYSILESVSLLALLYLLWVKACRKNRNNSGDQILFYFVVYFRLQLELRVCLHLLGVQGGSWVEAAMRASYSEECGAAHWPRQVSLVSSEPIYLGAMSRVVLCDQELCKCRWGVCLSVCLWWSEGRGWENEELAGEGNERADDHHCKNTA